MTSPLEPSSDCDQDSAHSFNLLPLQEALQNNLVSLGYQYMTAIQKQSLPPMLRGEDVIARAKTGTGKTAAFGLTLLNQLKLDSFAIQALVLCPTRELAEQVSQALRQLARLMSNIKILNLSGGTPMKWQLDSLRHGAHIVVGTPGRIQKHLSKLSLRLDQLQILVLDEADRMLDMGFLDEMKAIIAKCPKSRQTLLFSATYPEEVKKLSREFMRNPKEIFIESTHTPQTIEQHFYEAKNSDHKIALLKGILLNYQLSSTLIFCNTKEQTTQLTNTLVQAGFIAAALNGDMEQSDRDLTMIRFSNLSCPILVATDVAARGLDIKELPAVINFDLAFEHDVHIHRIGRTGRIGHKGLAFSLTTAKDIHRIAAIEDNLNYPLIWGSLSDFENGNKNILPPGMVTLCLNAGRKDKIRPADILGALIKDGGLPNQAIGKINITTFRSYIAVRQENGTQAYEFLQFGKLKGRKVLVTRL